MTVCYFCGKDKQCSNDVEDEFGKKQSACDECIINIIMHPASVGVKPSTME